MIGITKRTCSLPDCDRPLRAKGLCSAHYNQQYAPNRHAARVEVDCAQCGAPSSKDPSSAKRYANQFCSLPCRDAHRMAVLAAARPPRPEPAPPVDRRSPLRKAVEDGDNEGVIAAILLDSTVTTTGCWEWQRRLDRSGYPAARLGSRDLYVHRLALEARLGKPLGKQPAHHMCANAKCVNPDHLQPVSHRENSAEMLARVYLLGRIADLEAALATVAPGHALLSEAGAPSPV